MIESILIGVYGIGLLASFGFTMDYLRTANLRNTYTRQVLALNGALVVVLLLVLLTNLNVLDPGRVAYSVYIGFFLIVDAALMYQWVLLRRARKQHRG